MSRAIAVVSMLHEAPGRDSATRLFRGMPVLLWTLGRLRAAEGVDGHVVLCWDEQAEAVRSLDGAVGTHVCGPHRGIAQIEMMTVARNWADGWRGGLLSSCEFDLGFQPRWTIDATGAEAEIVVLVNAAAGLVDPDIVSSLVRQLRDRPAVEVAFAPVAPGLGGVALKRPLLERMAEAGAHVGRLISYHPDAPVRDPLGGEGCVNVPVSAARTTQSFKLDTRSAINRLEAALMPLNGELPTAGAAELVECVRDHEPTSLRDLNVELTTDRRSRPVWLPSQGEQVARREISLDTFESIALDVSHLDDLRVTFAGVGDPICHPRFETIIAKAAERFPGRVHVETDLLEVSEGSLAAILEYVDVLTIHLPAVVPSTYTRLMGVDRLGQVIETISRLVATRSSRARGLPIIVPTFTKLPDNLAEMETWYDQWMRAVGSVVIRGTSSYAGLIRDPGITEMAPPRRVACRRLSSRLTILADGSIVACEEDVTSRMPLGRVGEQGVLPTWDGPLAQLRRKHDAGEWGGCATCAQCDQWHRP